MTIVPFPNKQKPHFRLLNHALRVLFNNMRQDRVPPARMFVVYQSDDENKTVTYLNVGFSPDGLAKAIDSVLQDAERDPTRWDFD